MTPQPTLKVRVRSITHEADGILGFELRAAADEALPAFSAGAHVDVHLPGGQVRCYSLLNDPAESHRWCIGVHRDGRSSGGSRHLHEAVRPGDLLAVGAPRNHFALDESAPASVFIAGGIGITPMLAMIARARALGMPWTLHYAARSRRHAGFLERLEALATDGNGCVQLYFDQEAGGRRLDLAAVVAGLPHEAHVYCCGPASMLDAYEAASAGLPAARVHQERFNTGQAAATAGGYQVVLARSGKTLRVAPGQTLLDCLAAAGADPMSSCRQGICGTCEVRVLEGECDHRDLVLSPEERSANDRILPCCSGARSERLVLDL